MHDKKKRQKWKFSLLRYYDVETESPSVDITYQMYDHLNH